MEERITRYRNMSFNAENKLYNKCLDTLNYLYTKWYGSAFGVSSIDVLRLREDIMCGKTTITRYRKEFNESCLRQSLGLGPNDPLPPTKRKVNLSKISTEELQQELKKRGS